MEPPKGEDRDDALIVVAVGSDGEAAMTGAIAALVEQSPENADYPIWFSFDGNSFFRFSIGGEKEPVASPADDLAVLIRQRMDQVALERIRFVLVASMTDLRELSPSGELEESLYAWLLSIAGFKEEVACDYSFTPVLMAHGWDTALDGHRLELLEEFMSTKARASSMAYLLTSQSGETATILDKADLVAAASTFVELLCVLAYCAEDTAKELGLFAAEETAFDTKAGSRPVFGSAVVHKLGVGTPDAALDVLEQAWPELKASLFEVKVVPAPIALEKIPWPDLRESSEIEMDWRPNYLAGGDRRKEAYTAHLKAVRRQLVENRETEVGLLAPALLKVQDAARALEEGVANQINETAKNVMNRTGNRAKFGTLKQFYNDQIEGITKGRMAIVPTTFEGAAGKVFSATPKIDDNTVIEALEQPYNPWLLLIGSAVSCLLIASGCVALFRYLGLSTAYSLIAPVVLALALYSLPAWILVVRPTQRLVELYKRDVANDVWDWQGALAKAQRMAVEARIEASQRLLLDVIERQCRRRVEQLDLLGKSLELPYSSLCKLLGRRSHELGNDTESDVATKIDQTNSSMVTPLSPFRSASRLPSDALASASSELVSGWIDKQKQLFDDITIAVGRGEAKRAIELLASALEKETVQKLRLANYLRAEDVVKTLFFEHLAEGHPPGYLLRWLNAQNLGVHRLLVFPEELDQKVKTEIGQKIGKVKMVPVKIKNRAFAIDLVNTIALDDTDLITRTPAAGPAPAGGSDGS